MGEFHILSWNVRGLNKRDKQRSLSAFCQVNKIGLGAFLETKIKGEKVEDMMRSYFNGWSFYKGIINEGRILLVWKSNILVVDIIQESDQFMHTLIKEVRYNRKYCITFVYGRNTIQERYQLWRDLSNLHFPATAWLLTGDFNSVFNVDDRLGGRPVMAAEVVDAQGWKALGLADELRSIGSHYTWTNNQDGGGFGFRPFKFFNMWIDHANFKRTVLESWYKPVQVVGLDRVMVQLKRLARVLRLFNKQQVGDVERNFQIAKENYNRAQIQCQKNPLVAGFQIEEQIACTELTQQYKIYDSYLRQRSKVNWLRCGDDNTAFFHACLKHQKEINRITSFVSDTGQLVEDFDEVVDHFLVHFRNALGSNSKTDVKNAMFSIGFIKSSGPDGYGSGFFKAMWNEIGDDISDAILGFFQHGSLPKGLNNALLTLIPKVPNPTKAVEYRPIACCNALYKCISNMICSRLNVVLPVLINQNQGAFVKNRLLTHNILIFQDILKGYRRKHISPRCVMKVDLSKAYDSIDWNCLEDILTAFCFPGLFIKWIMTCLKDFSYSILLNGRIQGCFTGRKGLIQGDPISPLLFVLIMEYFTRSLIQATQDKVFKFHPRCKKLRLASLCFADDLVLFCKGNNSSVQVIQDCFKAFSAVSGLIANLEKSKIYFGELSVTETSEILKEIQIAEGDFPLKYLGVPLRPTKWQAGDCDVLLGIRAFWMSIFMLPKKIIAEIDHLCRKFLWGSSGRNDNRSKLHLTNWDQVCLPKQMGGVGFKDSVKWNMVLLAKYIWAVSTKQDVLWVKWIDAIYLKGQWNMVLLAKYIWVVSTKQDVLWVKWIDAIYLKGQSIWDHKLQVDVSWYWRNLIKLSTIINAEILAKSTVKNKLHTSKLYELLVHKDRVPFFHVVWCNLSMPKHRFILWQATLGHLLTRDNLVKCHLQIISELCPVCELQQESHDHLFFQCPFSQMVRQRVASWLNWDIWPIHYQEWINWMKGKPKGLQQKLLAAGLAAVVYLVWWNRNQCLYNHCSFSVNSVFTVLQNSLCARVKNLSSCKLSSKDVRFLESVNLL
ncbi:uncharacterized protein LOC133829344 [Humulus lupulus]|uniref:uncharacterized protein LOC133829344 n=1 Tax=Humulus lupulus TaxID=3486 RepID=UPI002B4081FF|nr:uncharacterized protein LOC133829344 [Humulus lupulus]